MEAHSGLRLNLGCGDRILPGYVSVDAVHSDEHPRDIVCDLVQGVPLKDGCAREILAVHLIEHFYRWDVPVVLADWFRLLRSGGFVAIECPDILKCARNLLNGTAGRKHENQLHLWGMYGDDRTRNPYMTHRWGYSPESLGADLAAAGFVSIRQEPTRFHPVGRDKRDMRLVAFKP